MPRRFPIFQFPNRPLIVSAMAGAVARVTRGRHSSHARLVSDLALLVWALEEVASGANWFRRMVGLGGAGYATRRLLGSARRPANAQVTPDRGPRCRVQARATPPR